ncbi:hypothetical protein FJZ28_04475 [Candidatus Peregrinibacteria bacterium]|nr:hypothetical protein [Candidatus Peregrinibacteria bacterium]
MDIHQLSRRRYGSTVFWAVIASIVVVGGAAALGRATMNIKGALTEKPDIAVYLLLPEEGITNVELLRERENERHYLVQTKEGPKLVVLRKGEEKWYVSLLEKLRE